MDKMERMERMEHIKLEQIKLEQLDRIEQLKLEQETSAFRNRRWLYGGPRPIWLNQMTLVKEMIREFDMSPLAPEHNPNLAPNPMQPVTKGEKMEYFHRKPFPGGLRHPHMHLGQEIFLLEEKQWRVFAERVTNRIADKLQNSMTIPFEKLLEIDDAITGF